MVSYPCCVVQSHGGNEFGLFMADPVLCVHLRVGSSDVTDDDESTTSTKTRTNPSHTKDDTILRQVPHVEVDKSPMTESVLELFWWWLVEKNGHVCPRDCHCLFVAEDTQSGNNKRLWPCCKGEEEHGSIDSHVGYAYIP